MKGYIRLVLLLLVASLIVYSESGTAFARTHVRVVRLSLTTAWRVPSPDPTGITYDPATGQLVVSDSEVDETPLWRGRNLFLAARRGHLQAARKLTKRTIEPEDVAWNLARQLLLVVDDDTDKVYAFRAGRDGRIGTRDDRSGVLIDTHTFGSSNPEGLGWRDRGRMLLVTDASNDRVYRIRRGRDKRFGTADDIVTSFGTGRFGFRQPEDVAFDPARGHLFIVSSQEDYIIETTQRGRRVRQIDLSSTNIRNPSGIVVAPARSGSGRHLFVTDRGKDNDRVPTENDGRLYEFAIVR